MSDMFCFKSGGVKVTGGLCKTEVPGQFCVRYAVSAAGNVLDRGYLMVDMLAIKNAVLKAIASHESAVGFSWSSVKRKARSVSKKVAVKKIARDLHKVASDPRFQQIATAAASIYPPLGVTMGVAVAAAKLYDAAKAGDPAARAKVMNIIEEARAGNTSAQDLAKSFAVFDAAAKKGHNVGAWADGIKKGWLANMPYRGNFEAGAMDRTNPRDWHRKILSVAQEATAKGW